MMNPVQHDRRTPTTRTIAILSTLLLTLSIACGNAATPEGEGGGDGGAGNAPSEVKNPGVFVHSLGGEPESLDPAATTDGGFGNRAIIQMYDFLVDIPPDSCRSGADDRDGGADQGERSGFP